MPRPPYHEQTATFPLYHTSRKKPRRWPLVLRFIKGAIHVDIALAVLLHALFAALVVYLDSVLEHHLALPNAIIPSLAIVVGLMLVFRNQTSYDRFWQGQQHLTMVETCIRNLTRSFLACSHDASRLPPSPDERADTERTVRILVAIMYAAKNHLRAEWGSTLSFLLPDDELRRTSTSTSTFKPEYTGLLPVGVEGFEEQGLGLPLQLSIAIEAYIKRGHDRAWFHAPQASQMTMQLNTLTASYGSMETIYLTPLPVVYLIHLRQVLALFGCALPFALVGEMGWWAILITTMVTFTLYGIEGIGAQLEDPFGHEKNDIKMDAIVEDLRVETMVLLQEWRRDGGMFHEIPS